MYEVLPLVKENLEYQKKQYEAERTNTIVIARKEYVQADGGGYKKSEFQGYHEGRPIEAFSRDAAYDRRSEGTDAQEVTRYSLPDPDPSEVFYDEIPLYDEQGNEIDFNSLTPEEAKKVLDNNVRQMLEAEYDYNVSEIRREARAAVNEAYRNIWDCAKKLFDEVVHSWWESIGGYESGVRNALISALQSVSKSRVV